MTKGLPLHRAAWITVAMLLLPACWVGDGRYVIRGKVLGKSDAVVSPVRGATVSVGDSPQANRRTETLGDGTYAVTYAVGGVFPFVNSGNPKLVFAAPGFQPRTVELQGASHAPDLPDVTRRACDPPRYDCFILDVVLVPVAAQDASPARAPAE